VELAQQLLRDIAARGLREGDLLGTDIEMVARHQVSRATVRQALGILERDGYISRHRARGTFVNRGIDPAADRHLVRGTALVVCSNEKTVHLDQDFAFAMVLRAMERALARDGFSVQILGCGENEEEDRARIARLGQQDHLEGICVIGSCLENHRHLLPQVPVVTSCTFYPLAAPWVGQDVKQASRDAVKYLLDRGHRDVALVCSPAIDQKAFGVFVGGYKAAFAEARQPFNRQFLYHAYPGESLADLATQVLSAPSRPTAIFAENWHVCQAIVAAANSLGLNIPGDLSLIGYGQNALQVAGPVLITSYVPAGEQIGQETARLLTSIIDSKPLVKEPLFIPGHLVERHSVKALEQT